MENIDVRRIFTYLLGEKPELLFVSGGDTSDESTKQMVKTLCEDRAKFLSGKGGFFIFARTMPKEGLFRALIAAPDGTRVAGLENVLGANELTIEVAYPDLVALGLPFTLEELIEFFTQALMGVVADYVPESAAAAQADAENSDPEPEPEPEKCQNCNTATKTLCKQVRGVTIN